MPDNDCVLEATNLSKSFPGVRALSGFDFQLRRGEIHGLLGENGAGKSTFIKLLNGLYMPDGGTFTIQGEKIDRLDPIVANQKGVKFVHQDLSVFPYLSIVDNIYMNSYPKTRTGAIDWKRAYAEVAQLLGEYDLNLDPGMKLYGLSIGQRQLIEIISNVSKNARVVVLDEPTASLGDTEKNKLFDVMRSLRLKGISIIFISHILEEVLSICDRITVVRDGRKVGTYDNRNLTRDFLIEKIVGEHIDAAVARTTHGDDGPAADRVVALELRDVGYKSFFKEISLRLHYGEIVSILGLLGAGKTEMADICFGLQKPTTGEILVNGTLETRMSPVRAIRHGIGYVTEDRHQSGVFQFLSVAKNCSIAILGRLSGLLGVVDRRKEESTVAEAVSFLNIKASSQLQEVRQLSGGNQQKVLLGRWLLADQKVLIFDEPTKGVDVGARNEFYRILQRLRSQKRAVLVLTSDHREALALSDRLFMLKGGRLVEHNLTEGSTPKEVLAHLTGE